LCDGLNCAAVIPVAVAVYVLKQKLETRRRLPWTGMPEKLLINPRTSIGVICDVGCSAATATSRLPRPELVVGAVAGVRAGVTKVSQFRR
jgi:hypothetical protein